MLIDRVLIAVVLLTCGSGTGRRIALLVLFIAVDRLSFRANLHKVPDGGWFPLLVGVVAFTLLTTWPRVRLMIDRMREASLPGEGILKSAVTLGRGCRYGGVHDQLGQGRAPRCCIISSTTRCSTSR